MNRQRLAILKSRMTRNRTEQEIKTAHDEFPRLKPPSESGAQLEIISSGTCVGYVYAAKMEIDRTEKEVAFKVYDPPGFRGKEVPLSDLVVSTEWVEIISLLGVGPAFYGIATIDSHHAIGMERIAGGHIDEMYGEKEHMLAAITEQTFQDLKRKLTIMVDAGIKLPDDFQFLAVTEGKHRGTTSIIDVDGLQWVPPNERKAQLEGICLVLQDARKSLGISTAKSYLQHIIGKEMEDFELVCRYLREFELDTKELVRGPGASGLSLIGSLLARGTLIEVKPDEVAEPKYKPRHSATEIVNALMSRMVLQRNVSVEPAERLFRKIQEVSGILIIQ